MNRRTSIIVSITGIVIIILALLGLTYGYYVSKITGNESTKSIEVITGDSSVKFTDLSEENINEIIEPGFTTTKSFTVENTGNIGATYSIYFVDVYNDFVRTEDIVYTLYRIDNDSTFPTDYEGCIENPTDEKSCKIVVNNAEFPTSVALIKANEVITAPEDKFRYDLVITYINQPDINQNVDQGHTFRGSINLRASMDDLNNPFSEGTLAYNILNNSINKLNGTEYIEPTLQDGTNYTKPAAQINNDEEKILTYTTDDYGTSYYYRGVVEDNYVTFAGMCWRIVRIAGDGSVKIVLEDQDEACSTSMNGNWGIPTTTGGTTYTGNYGYEEKNVDSDSSNEYIMSYLKPVTNADKSMARAFYDFQKDKLEDYKSKLKSGNWCLADKAYIQSGSSPNYTYTILEEYNYSSNMYYDSYVRLYGNSTKEPTLKCTGTIMDKFESVTYNETEIIEESPMYVSALTADEIVYAGGKVYSTNGNFYLLNENFKSGNAGYYYFWSLSPRDFSGSYDGAFSLEDDGNVYSYGVSNRRAFRPAVSLASSAVISSGEGTLEKPYVIG